MPIVSNPPHSAVLPNDVVFHMVQVITVGENLLPDALPGRFHILRVDQPMKCIASIYLKFFQILAAIYLEQRLVGVDQTLFLVGVINEKTARHSCGDLLDNGKSLLAENQRALRFLFVLHKSSSALSVV